MKEKFDIDGFKGLKRLIAINIDILHEGIITRDKKETRGIIMENFNELIDDIYTDIRTNIEIANDLK